MSGGGSAPSERGGVSSSPAPPAGASPQGPPRTPAPALARPPLLHKADCYDPIQGFTASSDCRPRENYRRGMVVSMAIRCRERLLTTPNCAEQGAFERRTPYLPGKWICTFYHGRPLARSGAFLYALACQPPFATPVPPRFWTPSPAFFLPLSPSPFISPLPLPLPLIASVRVPSR